jgi:hypothetical protein
MFTKTLITLASLLAATQALTITAPALDAKWDLSQTNTIEWTSVDTDPKNFTIVLVDHSSSSGAKQTEIKKLVDTADKKYAFSNFVATPGDKYQINFIGTEVSNQGIIAQSQNFKVTKSGVATSSTTTSSAPSGTESAPATTSTAQPNGAGAVVRGALGIVGSLGVMVYVLL